jgi:hypothetical protein
MKKPGVEIILSLACLYIGIIKGLRKNESNESLKKN